MNEINIESAKEILLGGDIIAIPTETVYGLAAVFNNLTAVRKIFDLKQRPLDHPLIMHLSDIKKIYEYCIDIPKYVPKLIERFSPGPLTVVLKKSNKVPDMVTAGQDTVAVRIPAHPKTLALLAALDTPVVAPSANPYCRISATQPKHVFSYFGEKVSILNGGACQVGIESTIILATDPTQITILRPGLITRDEIQKTANIKCHDKNDASIKFPGNKRKHYAPKSALYTAKSKEEILNFAASTCKNYYFILSEIINTRHHQHILMPSSPTEYARKIYDLFHQIDGKYDAIIIQMPPNQAEWQGVLDRLHRASNGL